ncbi:hypothetical protein [Gemmatimonas sp.]|jgi:hypothetical protein|uniref:hypothetical protein n=1 Tax=Gemmatimonas sp. TaxID=1962908 RepID=UPI0037C165DC
MVYPGRDEARLVPLAEYARRPVSELRTLVIGCYAEMNRRRTVPHFTTDPLAGERERILVRPGLAADAREAVVEHANGEELVRDLRDHGS